MAPCSLNQPHAMSTIPTLQSGFPGTPAQGGFEGTPPYDSVLAGSPDVLHIMSSLRLGETGAAGVWCRPQGCASVHHKRNQTQSGSIRKLEDDCQSTKCVSGHLQVGTFVFAYRTPARARRAIHANDFAGGLLGIAGLGARQLGRCRRAASCRVFWCSRVRGRLPAAIAVKPHRGAFAAW